MLNTISNNIHFLGGFHVRLEPVSKIRIIRHLKSLSKIGEISKTLEINTNDKKIEQNK